MVIHHYPYYNDHFGDIPPCFDKPNLYFAINIYKYPNYIPAMVDVLGPISTLSTAGLLQCDFGIGFTTSALQKGGDLSAASCDRVAHETVGEGAQTPREIFESHPTIKHLHLIVKNVCKTPTKPWFLESL